MEFEHYVNRNNHIPLKLYSLAQAVLCYVAFFGCLCSLGYLSAAGLLPLLPGALGAALFCLLPRRRGWALGAALALLLLAAGLALLRWNSVTGGLRLYLSRVFAASEQRQRYRYERPDAAGAGIPELKLALLVLGLPGGLLFGLSARCRLLPLGAGLLGGLCLFLAWLGLTPSTPWLLALAGAALLLLLPPRPRSLLPLGLAAVLAALALWLLPGENPQLSAWSDTARDRLAAQTVAYTDEQPQPEQPTEPSPSGGKDYRQLEAPEAESEYEPVPQKSAFERALPLILLLLALLFVPALVSDRLRRLRTQRRAGLDDPDPAAHIRAAFLYAMRWLRLGGLDPGNEPYSRLADRLAGQYPALLPAFSQALPLWQQAAYSGAAPAPDARGQMDAFRAQTVAAVRPALSLPRRLLAKLTM